MIPTLPVSTRKRLALVGIAFVGVGWAIWSTRNALFPFILGGIIAYLLAPLVDRIQRAFPTKGRLGVVARPLAILATYIVILGILVGAGFWLVPPLVRQTVDFINVLPAYWQDVQREMNSLVTQYRQQVPVPVQRQIEQNLGAIGAQIGAAARAALVVTFGAVGTIIGVAAGLALLPIWMFYILKDQRKGLQWFYGLWPESWQTDVRAIVGLVDSVLAAYIRGQLFLGLVIGVVTGLAMWAIGIQQSVVLGLLAGIFELIPVLGPWLGFVAAALVTLATDPDRIWLVGIAFLAIQQLENTFLVPKIQGDAVRVHPAMIIVLLVVGGALWGIWGLVIVVPLAAILRDIFVYLYRRAEEA